MPFASSVLEKQHGVSVEIMRNTELIEHASVETDEMRNEYQLDYSKAKPNRFADKIGQDQLMIVLDPDVAAVFKTPESANRVLRALITSMPTMQKTTDDFVLPQEATDDLISIRKLLNPSVLRQKEVN